MEIKIYPIFEWLKRLLTKKRTFRLYDAGYRDYLNHPVSEHHRKRWIFRRKETIDKPITILKSKGNN